jgi:hypothetical protein
VAAVVGNGGDMTEQSARRETFLGYWWSVLRRVPALSWKSANRLRTIVALLLMIVAAFNKQLGKLASDTWQGVPGKYVLTLIGLFLIWEVMQAVYERDANRQELLAEAEKQAEQAKHGAAASRPSRDWQGDWKELSTRFGEMANILIAADYVGSSEDESWNLRGSPAVVVRRLESLCKLAGNLLIASPNVSRNLPSDLRAHPDPINRWLFYLKIRPGAFKNVGYGAGTSGTGEKIHYQMGSIEQLATVSASECISCAADEFV